MYYLIDLLFLHFRLCKQNPIKKTNLVGSVRKRVLPPPISPGTFLESCSEMDKPFPYYKFINFWYKYYIFPLLTSMIFYFENTGEAGFVIFKNYLTHLLSREGCNGYYLNHKSKRIQSLSKYFETNILDLRLPFNR